MDPALGGRTWGASGQLYKLYYTHWFRHSLRIPTDGECGGTLYLVWVVLWTVVNVSIGHWRHRDGATVLRIIIIMQLWTDFKQKRSQTHFEKNLKNSLIW